MAWYKTGTVSVTNNSATVTGSGTNFVSGAQVGFGFQGPNGLVYEITAINSSTSLTITPVYGGSTASGQAYAIVPTQGLTAALASDVTDLITDYQTVADNAGAGKFGDGSAASPGIRFVNDQDTGFFKDTANEIAVSVGGSKVGEFTSTGIDGTVIGGTTPAAGNFTTLTSDGLTVDGNSTINGVLTVDGTSNQDAPLRIDSSDAKAVILFDDGATTSTVEAGVNSNNFIINNNGLRLNISNNGDISFYEDTGTTPKFFWDASAESLGIGTSSPSAKLTINRNTSDGDIAVFQKDGTTVGSISVTGSSTAYNTSSDYRLKTDVQPMIDASARVQALKPVNFEWISDGTRVDGFLAHEVQSVAPEVATGTKDAMRDEEYEVIPAVYEDVVIPAVLDDDGNELEAERTEQRLVTEAVMGTRRVPDYQGIDQSKLVPLLTAALQEALTKIDDLETRLEALE